MTNAEHQEMVDIARLQVHEYFDHYLSDVFPQQMDRIMESHNQDAEAHEPRLKALVQSKRRFDRLTWMILGGSAVVGCIGGLLAQHLPGIIKALIP